MGEDADRRLSPGHTEFAEFAEALTRARARAEQREVELILERFRAALPPPAPDEGDEVRQLRQSLFDEGEVSPENVVYARALREVGDPGSLGETRLIVITAGEDDPTGLPGPIVARLRRAWFALQTDYAHRSTDSVHVIARYSPHFIQSNLGQPELVVKAIREVVLAARDDRQLQECRALFQPPGAKCPS